MMATFRLGKPLTANESLKALEVRAAPVYAPAPRAERESTKPSENLRWHAVRDYRARYGPQQRITTHAAREWPQILLQGERMDDLLDLQLRVRRSQSIAARQCFALEQPEVARQDDTSVACRDGNQFRVIDLR
jgi:hypothetical protein